MYSCTPNTSETTRTTGRLVLPAGIARYAGSLKSPTGIVTSPTVKPLLSVLIACALTGSTAAAKPLPTAVRTKSRRLKERLGTRLSSSGCSMTDDPKKESAILERSPRHVGRQGTARAPPQCPDA